MPAKFSPSQKLFGGGNSYCNTPDTTPADAGDGAGGGSLPPSPSPPPLQALIVSAVTNSSNGRAIAANEFLMVLPKRVVNFGLPDRRIMPTVLKLSMIYCDLCPLPLLSIDRIWLR
jgi:hypothetical protein